MTSMQAASVPTGRDPAQHLRLVVAYDGTDFHGFAENDGVRTVAGVLRTALESVLGQPVGLTCAGRTDSGVHARGQVVSVRWSGEPSGAESVDPGRLRRSLVTMLGPEVVVRSVDRAPHGFDARFSATGRTYRYEVWNHVDPDPFRDRFAWWVPEPLDVDTMQSAAEVLLGEHDFATFCRRPRRGVTSGATVADAGGGEPSLVRRLERVRWTRTGSDEPVPGDRSAADGGLAVRPSGLVRFEITASAFCHQMVRSIVGLLVEVGRGRRTVADVAAALEARDRSHLPTLAPPRGLTLWAVHYD